MGLSDVTHRPGPSSGASRTMNEWKRGKRSKAARVPLLWRLGEKASDLRQMKYQQREKDIE